MPKQKPEKPYEGFPLFAHASGQWAKKIRGKLHYFGVWTDWQAALNKYLKVRDDLQAGRTPRDDALESQSQIHDVVNGFLTAKKRLVQSGELSPRTFETYHATGIRLAEFFGRDRLVSDLRPLDFDQLRSHLAEKRGPTALGNEVQRVRSFFKYAYEAGLIPHPMNFGPHFKKPSRKLMRKQKNLAGERMFETEELRAILQAAAQPLHAMILLGINCGFGQTDVARLTFSAIDLERGWVNFPRPKTEVPRHCPLWSETLNSLRSAIQSRPVPRLPEFEELVFVTRYGLPWVRHNQEGVKNDEVGKQFTKLLKKIGHKRPGINFYALRHTFETIGGESKDQPAVDWIMGHARADMATLYRERISEERLIAVTQQIHGWLFPPEEHNQTVTPLQFCDTEKIFPRLAE